MKYVVMCLFCYSTYALTVVTNPDDCTKTIWSVCKLTNGSFSDGNEWTSAKGKGCCPEDCCTFYHKGETPPVGYDYYICY